MDVKNFALFLRRLPALSVNLIVLLVLPAVIGCSKKEAPPPPPPEVQVAEVVQRDVPIYIELVGSTLGSEDVEIRARVAPSARSPTTTTRAASADGGCETVAHS